MKKNRSVPQKTFGVESDFMTAGIENIIDHKKSPQQLPGRKHPPKPLDDRKGAGLSLGELAKEELEDMIDN